MSLAIVGIRKFWTRSATLVSLIIAVALVGLLLILEGFAYSSASKQADVQKSTFEWLLTFPSAYDGVLAFTASFAGIIGLIYVATVAGSEWTWGTLKVAVARGQSRSQYAIATFASLAILVLVGLVVTYAVGLLAAAIGGSLAGFKLGNPGDPTAVGQALVKLARAGIGLVALTSLGYAITMVAKSQMAGIGTVIGYFIVSIIGPAFLPDAVKEVFKYLPFSVASDAIGLQGPPGSVSGSANSIDPNLALLVAVAWLIGCLAVTAIAVERTEITG